MDLSQAQLLVNSYIEGYNDSDVAGMLACLQPDIIFENIENSRVTLRLDGKAAFEDQASKSVGWFMERHQQVTAFRFEDGRAEADIDYFAITSVDLPKYGLKAGTILQFTSKSIFTFRDNLIDSIQDISQGASS
ncbi:nuclear transport factor 2 family protein [Hymenobacter sp.]|jgi:hypothetical protein|uniref:nuclear transport factor 2 family protein n=1 Tax=Hymenobacter sp. TaxID=1898978 RepID=UPI002ED78C61